MAGAATPVRPAQRATRWLAPLLAALGGSCAGAATVALVALALVGAPPGPLASSFLEPDTTAFGAADPPLAVTTASGELVVDVAGAVAHPGLHRLRAGDRVGDAIEAAGGFAPRADLAAASESLNLAQPLEDGTKVLVPELGIDRVSGGASTADDERIDLNRAGRSELEMLPGIGPVTAGRIVESREREPFAAVRELRSRGLVGEKVYEDIQALVRTR